MQFFRAEPSRGDFPRALAPKERSIKNSKPSRARGGGRGAEEHGQARLSGSPARATIAAATTSGGAGRAQQQSRRERGARRVA
eukprot:3780479-Pyramimonas_sp.AAC.1